MGLDLYVYVPHPESGFGGSLYSHWSYGGFMFFRERLCEAAGLGDIKTYRGFGGTKPWPSTTDEPLVAVLSHSDCDGELWSGELEGVGARLREVVSEWDDATHDKQSALRLAAMCEYVEQEGGAVAFR